MFVLASKYNALARRYVRLCVEGKALAKQWNELVEKVNAKGGQAFLDGKVQSQFTRDEIDTMIVLCHPDKHGGTEKMTRITQKLLSMRK